MRKVLGVLMVLTMVVISCSDGEDTTAGDETTTSTGGGASGTLRVPDDYPTIQEAVDAAAPGSLILIGPGTYNEAVDVTTNDLVLRGTDRNEVVLDGEFELENGVRVLGADGVAVENMTAKNYTRNGFFWTTGVDGFRASYVTAIRNGDYGVYAIASRNGIFEHSYASGSPDAGFYVGQCYPCNVLIDDVVSEFNGLGYSGTNSGGDLTIVNSVFRHNRAGIVPNSGSYEGCAPERNSTIVGNLIYSNNNVETPAISAAVTALGNGILTSGGVGNLIERNRVWDHDIAGIALVPFPEENPIAPIPEDPPTDCIANAEPAAPEVVADLPELMLWPAEENVVRGNVVSDSREADLVLVSTAESGNRLCENEHSTTLPADLETVAPCDGDLGELDPAATARFLELVEREKPGPIPYEEVDLPDPGPQEQMPDAETAPARPARDLDITVDLDAVVIPDPPPED